jgi:hypothetical protein
MSFSNGVLSFSVFSTITSVFSTTTFLGDQQHNVKKQQQQYDIKISILLSHP